MCETKSFWVSYKKFIDEKSSEVVGSAKRKSLGLKKILRQGIIEKSSLKGRTDFE